MVVSLINSVVNYIENSNVDKKDKMHAATVYETEILDDYVSIALGQQRSSENLVFYPIYLVTKKADGKTKLIQIGVYEMLFSDLSTLLDEDGDLDIDQLSPLLYNSYEKKHSSVQQEQREYSNENTNNENTSNENTSNENTSNDEENQKERVWINNIVGNKSTYEIPENDGGGDCLFFALRDALESKGKMMSVSELRLILSKAATQPIYAEYANMYNMFSEMLIRTNSRIAEIAKENEGLKLTLTKETLREKQKQIVEKAKRLKTEFLELKDEKKTATSYLREYAFMKGIDSLEKFKKVLRKRRYWADSWALATLEEVLNIKFIILSKESYDDKDNDNIMRCGEMTTTLEAKGHFNPDFYVVVEKSFNHYRLIIVNGKKTLREKEIPQELLGLIKNKCLEKMSGTFAMIPFFKDMVTDNEGANGKGTNGKGTNGKGTNTNREPKLDIEGLYDPHIRFVFYHKSAHKPLPGKGVGEKIPKENVKSFIELSKIKNWRQKLDRTWIQKFEAEGHDWASVEHFYQAGKFKESSPEFYQQFSLDSGSDLSKDALMAKSAGGPSGKYKGLKIRPKEIGAPMAFFGVQQSQRMRAGHRAKYEHNPDLKAMLLATKNAELTHFKAKRPIEPYKILMEVRKDFTSK